MNSLQRGWHYLLAELFIWITYCFFQPTRFQRELEISGYFRLKRIIPILRVSIPLFLGSFLLFCCALYVAIMVRSFVITTTQFLSITAWLFLGLTILALLGGFILSIARGIALASAWSLAFIVSALFFSSIFNNSDGLLVIFLEFGIIGGIVFGTIFGNSSDLSGDLIGNIVWTAGIFSIWIVMPHTWNDLALLFVAVPVGSITGGLVVWAMTRTKQKIKGENLLKKSLLWGNLWGLSLTILLGKVASEGKNTAPSIVASSVLAYAIFCFFGIVIYMVGYYRVVLYPFCLYSTLKTYFLSKLYPSNVFYYVRHCSLYWDECVFLPLLGLQQTLLIAAQQDEDGRRAMEDITFLITERPQQIAIARAVSQELAMRDLERWSDLTAISQAHKRLSVFLPQEAALIDQQWVTPFSPLRDASHDAERYMHLANQKAQRRVLESLITNLERARAKDAFGIAALNKRLSEVIDTWLAVTHQEYERLGEVPFSNGQIDNPFSPGLPLKLHDSLFVGRLDLAQQLEGALSRKNHRPTFLLNGERRMGKTSVLMQLPSLLGPHYLPIFYDLQQRGSSSSAAALLTSIAREISQVMHSQGMRAKKLEYARLQESNQKNEALAYHLFEEWFHDIERDLEQEDKTLLLTFDEFEIFAESGNALFLNLSLLLDWFHNVMQHHPRLALLFSGERTFSDMGPDWVSNFVTVQTLKVSFLHPAEARKLITQPDDSDGSADHPFNEDIVEEIIRVTACHPFLVQALCSVLIDSLNVEERTQAHVSDVTTGVHQVLERWSDYFLDVWIRADAEQKSCLTAIASLEGCNSFDVMKQIGLDEHTVQRTLQNLSKRDLIRTENGNYRIAVPIFREWMKQNTELSERDTHNYSLNQRKDLPVNDDFDTSDTYEITILPSPLHPSRSKLERNAEKRPALEQDNGTLTSPSTVRSSPVPSTPSRPRQLLWINLAVLFIIAGSVLIVPTILNRFVNRPSIARTTASVTNPYGQGGTLVLNDPLQNNSLGYSWTETVGSCQFVQGTYHVSAPANVGVGCPASPDFSNFAFEVQMTIMKGDSGGIAFRLDSMNQTRYIFHVDEDGDYDLARYKGYIDTISQPLIYPVHSSAIHQGLGQTNIIAVVAQGNTITLYVNYQQIAMVADSTYSHGRIAVVAYSNNGHATEVAYSNAKVWNLSARSISGLTISSILHGAVATPPSQVNLTSEGTSDWIHWGLYTNRIVDRKNEVPLQISTFTTIGNATALAYGNNSVAYSWSDGTPDRTIANTTTGVYVSGINNGFSFSVPASTTTRTLRVYVDVWLSRGKLIASLTDGSGLVYTDESLNNPEDTTQAVYTLTYRSSSNGQRLTITFVEVNAYNSIANVALEAATLQ